MSRLPPHDGAATFALVMALVRGRDTTGALVHAADPEWAAAFLAFLKRHALAGFVFAQAEKSDLLGALPAEVRRALRDAYLGQWSQSEALLGRMQDLSGLLAAAGLECVFLKGPLFAKRYYGNVDRRLTGDVDLLVRRGDVAAVDSCLRRAGFRQRSRLLISRAAAMRFTHHLEYERGDAVVEMHWEFATHFTYRLDETRIWAERRLAEERGQRFPIPSPHDDLLVQLLTIFKDTELGTIAARAFVDLYQMLRVLEPELDWRAFFAAREREGLLAISANMLDLGLEVAAARDEFPALAAALDVHRALLVDRARPRAGLDIFTAAPPALGNKARLFRLYDCNLAAAVAWWIVSLPWRVTVYRKS